MQATKNISSKSTSKEVHIGVVSYFLLGSFAISVAFGSLFLSKGVQT